MAKRNAVPGETIDATNENAPDAADAVEMTAAVEHDTASEVEANDDLNTDQLVQILSERLEMQADEIGELRAELQQLKLVVMKVSAGVQREPEAPQMSRAEATEKAKMTGKAQLSVDGYIQP